MNMNKIFCSTGAIISKKNNRDYRLIKEFAPLINCDGFEFLMYDSWYAEWLQISEALYNMNVKFSVFHVEKKVGELISRNEDGDIAEAHRLFEINCKMAKVIGAEKLVLHLWGGLPSDRIIYTNIEQFAVLQKTAFQYGLLLTVENVPCNYENPLLHLKRLKQIYPEIAFTFDVKFAQFHNELDTSFSNEYRWLWDGSVQHVHINDYDGGYKQWERLRSLHPGDGNIDFEKLFQKLKEVTYNHTFTIESSSVCDDGTIDLEKLNGSIEFLRKLCNF